MIAYFSLTNSQNIAAAETFEFNVEVNDSKKFIMNEQQVLSIKQLEWYIPSTKIEILNLETFNNYFKCRFCSK